MTTQAQEKNELPYYELEEGGKEYSAGLVASRMIDGLGFRYYWATEGLTKKDLVFKPNKEARSVEQTIDHILGLSQITLNAVLKKANQTLKVEMSFSEKRRKTLENLKKASDILRNSKDVSQYKMIFSTNEFPFWNVINGPVADALWHTGQVVSFRRSSGNPFSKEVNVLTGKVKKQ
jgi:hypothetical protein